MIVLLIFEVEMMNTYEYHILELWDEELNVKKSIAVIDATFAVAKRKPEKKNLGLYGI